MRNENGRISVDAIVIIALLLLIVLPGIKENAKDLLFKAGFFHPTKAEVEEYVKHGAARDIVTCHETTGDWDYICDHTNFPTFAPDKPEKFKWGVRIGRLAPVSVQEGLVLSEPTPTTREENLRRNREESDRLRRKQLRP